MKAFTKKILQLLLITCLSSCAWLDFGSNKIESRSMKQHFSDSTLENKLTRLFDSNNSQLNNTNVYVMVYNQQVLLTGQYVTDEQQVYLEQEVRGTPGVSKLYNYMLQRLPTTMSIRAKDTYITTIITTKLFSTKDLESGRVHVMVTSGVVYLMGSLAPSEALKAARLCAAIDGVTKVVTLFDSSSDKNS